MGVVFYFGFVHRDRPAAARDCGSWLWRFPTAQSASRRPCPALNSGMGVGLVFVRLLGSHSVLLHEAVNATLGVENLLGAGEEGVVTTPDVDVNLGLGGPC